jgi:cyanophycinase
MIALVGSGEYLEGMLAVDAELMNRLGEPARVVCLPTAAGQEGADRILYWSRLGVEHFTRLEAQVQALPVIDRDSAEDERWAQAAAQANFVYLSGGSPAYLYQTLRNSRVWEAIQQVVAKGGILAGCSAGAMVMGEVFFGFPGWKAGFNLLPGAAILPHYDEIPPVMLKPLRLLVGRKITILGIEGSTALVLDGRQAEIMGSGGVTVWNGAGKLRYTAGQQPTW